MSVTITTNNVPRDLLYGVDLTPADYNQARSELDYLDDTEFNETMMFKYRNQWYDIDSFVAFQHETSGWHGYFGLTVWSAIYVKIVGDCKSIVVGFAHW